MLARVNLSLRLNALHVLLGMCAVIGLLWLDSNIPIAGLWMLVGLSASLGFAHGALDVQLMQQYFSRASSVLLFSFLYLLMVLCLGWVLMAEAGMALCLLLLMSVWHFGESYARWNDLPSSGLWLTRCVVGGAPVMLPALLSQQALISSLQSAPLQQALEVWIWFAQAWMVLFFIWILIFGTRHFRAARYAWFELSGVLILNLLFSPLMAFALYFGIYHAPLHIWRVWQTQSGTGKLTHANWMIVSGVFVFTLLLCAILWWWLGQKITAYPSQEMVKQWLIIALTALTLPHLILVSLCEPLLSGATKIR